MNENVDQEQVEPDSDRPCGYEPLSSGPSTEDSTEEDYNVDSLVEMHLEGGPSWEEGTHSNEHKEHILNLVAMQEFERRYKEQVMGSQLLAPLSENLLSTLGDLNEVQRAALEEVAPALASLYGKN
jgi:hypothetical protein